MCACLAVTATRLSGQTAGQTPPANPPTPTAAQTPAPAAVQAPAPAPAPRIQTPPAKRKVWSIGLRARDFPIKSMSVMDTRATLATTAKPGEPVRDWNFNTNSRSAFWGAGIAAEYAPSDRWTVTAEILFNQLKYTKVTSIAWGTDTPTTTTDERTHMFRNEDTRASLFDLPVLVHHNLRESGPLARVYVAIGAAVRTVVNVKSTLQTTFPDTSSTTTTPAAPLSKRNMLGGVVGIGLRIVDDFNINWTPEVRYTRWAGSTFATDSTLSPRNQLEIGLGFTF